MTQNNYSKYDNANPPYKDENWLYKNADSTQIYNTWLKHGLQSKVIYV